MSATGRGASRSSLDGYYTQPPLACAIVDRLRNDGILRPNTRILEPSVGKGAFVAALVEQMEGISIDCVDVVRRAELVDVLDPLMGVEGGFQCIDFVDFSAATALPYMGGKYDAIIGNPPYEHAEAHIRHGIELLDEGGSLAFLLRIDFLSSKKRVAGLYAEHPPAVVYVLDKRPSFGTSASCAAEPPCGWRAFYEHGMAIPSSCPSCGGGRKMCASDMCEYGVFVWTKDIPQQSLLKFLKWSARYDEWRASHKRQRR